MARLKRRVVKSESGRQREAEQLKNRGSVMSLCRTCGFNEEKVDVGYALVACSTCVQKQAAPPPEQKPLPTPEEKSLRSARKLEKARQFEAKRSKLVIPPTDKDLGYAKGWQWKKLFTTALDEKGQPTEPKYFTVGKEITKDEYDVLFGQFANEAIVKATEEKPTKVKKETTPAELVTLVSPEGTPVSLTLRGFLKEYKLYPKYIREVLSGIRKNTKGWTKAQ